MKFWLLFEALFFIFAANMAIIGEPNVYIKYILGLAFLSVATHDIIKAIKEK
jgi:hypothetical protein